MTLWQYIKQQKDRDDAVGDFARDALSDPRFPRRAEQFGPLEKHLQLGGACDGAIRAARRAWREWGVVCKQDRLERQGGQVNQILGQQFQGVSVEQVMVSPAMAEEWIKRDKGNRTIDGSRSRPVVESRVAMYASAMGRGEWVINGETIAFSPYGHILNGNHRLRAIVRAGLSVPLLVARGVDASTFGTMDQGVKRTTAHVAAIAGVKHASLVSAAARLAMMYRNHGMPLMQDPRLLPSSQAILSFIEASRAEWEESARVCYPGFKVARPALLVAWHWLVGAMPEERSIFLDDLTYGRNLGPTRPVYLLRERLMKGQSRVAPLIPKMQAALLFRAWNAEVQGTEMKQLRWSPDTEFPRLLGSRFEVDIRVA